jgi:hypothetical protein
MRREPAPVERVVRVTIGRVDVRAVQPAAPERPAPRQKPEPRLSLDEYLRGDRKA